jgi:molybdopterin molybdotransferase
MVTFELFARPVIRKMLGHATWHRAPVEVTLAEPLSFGADLTHFLRVTLTRDGMRLVAHLTGPQSSGILSSMARADALLIVPRGRLEVAAGETMFALLLSDGAGHARTPLGSP